MRFSASVLALAAILLLSADVSAQTTRDVPETRTRTAVNANAAAAAPRWGFAIGMRPGPNNTFTHPHVHTVVAGSNAEEAGIEVGDVILSVNGRDARQPPLFPVREAGTRYVLRVRRGQEELELVFIYPETSRSAPAEDRPN